jgi:hypothetical protein
MAGADRSMTQPRRHAAKERDRHFGRSPTHLRRREGLQPRGRDARGQLGGPFPPHVPSASGLQAALCASHGGPTPTRSRLGSITARRWACGEVGAKVSAELDDASHRPTLDRPTAEITANLKR